MQIVNLLISAVLQVILFSIIPVIWWLVFGKKESTFLNWIGLKGLKIKRKMAYLFIFLLNIILLSSTLLIIPIFIDESSLAQAQFAGQGWSAFIPVLIYAFLQTGFSEELFFRGFLTKRLINKFGFQIGNVTQGFLFGIVHGLMIISTAGIIGAIIITIITAVSGYLMGLINEKFSNGSILSSWLVHGTVNTLASIIVMFNLI